MHTFVTCGNIHFVTFVSSYTKLVSITLFLISVINLLILMCASDKLLLFQMIKREILEVHVSMSVLYVKSEGIIELPIFFKLLPNNVYRPLHYTHKNLILLN